MVAEAGERQAPMRLDAIVATGILVALVVASPLAMSFTPFPEMGQHGVWSQAYAANPSYGLRASLIAFGLLGTVAAVAIAVATYARERRWSRRTLAATSVAVSCWAVGWRSYPYWVNGVFRASDVAAGGAYDPKALPPMTWIGELWRVPVIILYPLAFLWATVVLAAALRAIFTTGGKSRWAWAVIITSAITLGSLLYCPGYGPWLMD
jgi:hypothetical protein